jgi:DNA polymerase III psi subunit
MDDLHDIPSVLKEIDKKLNIYYSSLYSMDKNTIDLTALGAEFSIMYWFLAEAETKAKTELDITEAEAYLDIRKNNEGLTIPEIESESKLKVKDIKKYQMRLSSALKSLDKILIHIAIRIKVMMKENQGTAYEQIMT